MEFYFLSRDIKNMLLTQDTNNIHNSCVKRGGLSFSKHGAVYSRDSTNAKLGLPVVCANIGGLVTCQNKNALDLTTR
jgi:hypothetical protein